MKMKIKNLLITVFVLAALSMAAYSLNKITQVTDDISLEEVKDCKTVYWEETEPIYGYVTRERALYGNCTEWSEENQTFYDYACVKGTEQYQSYEEVGEKTLQKSKEECED